MNNVQLLSALRAAEIEYIRNPSEGNLKEKQRLEREAFSRGLLGSF